jgi:transcription-repair coupling factor (superfamily II helicase)
MFKSLKLYIGQEIDMQVVRDTLFDFGYKRYSEISNVGEFAIRGAILDIWPVTFELPVRCEWQDNKITTLRSIDIPTYKSFWDHTFLIILPVKRLFYTRVVYCADDTPINNFLDIKQGDYIVHTKYGIGRFLGLEKIKIGEKLLDHLIIEYDEKERLFVPVNDISKVHKYVGFGRTHPKLNSLKRRKDWAYTKKRVTKGIQRLAWEILTTQALRRIKKGFRYLENSSWEEEFEKGFIFKETPDQKKAWQKIKTDMEQAKCMDILLCGDTGYGKTEVAMRAAFKAAINNKQVAFLVPTTILAEQHYQNFKRRLEKFPIRCEMFSRLLKRSEQKRIIEDLAKGLVDIIIGTHRLLCADVKFKDLGLLIIDEEQRFGVREKERLKRLKIDCDILTLTATPIPRTLYMSLMEIRDLLVINTPPENRLPIKTYVLEYDEDIILQAILNEKRRQGQTYFVHNRILDMQKITERLRNILPSNINVGYVHGQMSPSQIEKTMLDFLNKKIDVLVSTAIIESGIDIPTVNTLIVNEADSFGLADLHQLRGRVGRFDKPAYAYFLIPKKGVISTEAKMRLDTIQRYSELGSGFKIAMQDLEIRGAGNLLGKEQHGFINSVGFDLYCRLLRECVESFRKISIE